MPPDDAPELFPASPRDAGDASPEAPHPHAPLADRMRPRSLEEILGQDHLLAGGAALGSLVEAGELPSLILWVHVYPLDAGPFGVAEKSLQMHGRIMGAE